MPLHVNVAGTWKRGRPYVNISGTWKLASALWVNVSGAWKKAWDANGSWTTKASMPTDRSDLAAAAPGNGRIYAVGGLRYSTSYTYLTVNEEYDPSTNTWTTKANMPTARADLAAVAPGNGRIYAVGGYTTSSGVLATNEEYNPSTNTWTSKASMPTARSNPAAAAPGNGKVYAIGGHSYQGLKFNYFTVNEEYNPSTNTWTSKASIPTVRTATGVAAPGNGKIYVIGGKNDSGIIAINEEYDPSTNTWTSKANMPTARSGLAAATPGNGKVYAVGGYNTSGTITATNEEYDPSTNTWASKASMFTARNALAAAAPGNGRMYAIGGYSSAYIATNEEYDAP